MRGSKIRALRPVCVALALAGTTLIAVEVSGSAVANAGVLDMARGCDSNGLDCFSYPSVCQYEWNASARGPDTAWIATQCPADQGFANYEFDYGSGNSDGLVVDSFSTVYAADGQWHTNTVVVVPHDPNQMHADWTNVKMVPCYQGHDGQHCTGT